MAQLINHLNKRRVQLIQVHSIFNNRSYNGYNKKVLLSGICKYYRRGIYDKFLWCVMEMVLFKYHKKGICLVTNVINRMRILIMEELLFSENISVIIEAIHMIESINQKTMNIEEIMQRIYSFCKIVKQCNRSRVVSYFKEWFRYEGEAGFTIPFVLSAIDENNMNYELVESFKKTGDSPKLLQLGELLLKTLEEDDLYEKSRIIMRLYWEFVKIKDGSGRRYRRKKGIYLFWEIMDSYMKKKGAKVAQKWEVIFKFGLTQYFREQLRERNAFGIWMILYCIYSDRIEWDNEIKDSDSVLCDIGEVLEYMKIRETSDVQVDEDFVIKDWHVNRDYDIGQFARIGAYVKNEKNIVIDETLYNNMKKYFIKKKTKIGNKEKERKRSLSRSNRHM